MKASAALAEEIAAACAAKMQELGVATMSFDDQANGMSASALRPEALADFFARYVPRIRDVEYERQTGYAQIIATARWPMGTWSQSWDCLA